MIPVLPQSETDRLGAVRRYDILDTPPDGAFDRITSLAADLFQVPIAIVSLVDEDRIWFKSHHGLDVDEIPRSPGLCASAILGSEPWVLEDARFNAHSMTNPLVAGDFGLRFYAGVPLRTWDGFNLGTLCVIDKEARETCPAEVRRLEDLAAIVMDEIELRRSALDAVSQLKKSLEQRDVLLREVHHRVKNNLQTIASLVSLHARTVDAPVGPHFDDVLRRINSIARLHERFYRGDNLAEIDLVKYVGDLAENIIETYGMSDRIEVLTSGHAGTIGLEQGTPVALIMAEVLFNSCKHAFPGEMAGRISVTGNRIGSDVSVTIADTGTGMVTKERAGSSMGLRLANLMARQLGGQCSLESRPGEGTVFDLRFPMQ